MADESPVGSPLSDLSSDAFEGEEEHERMTAEALMPPAKRQKLGESSTRATPVPFPAEYAGSISSDSSGDIPNSPSHLRTEDDDSHEQVTVCSWTGCAAGDLGNMDKLVEHIHNEHIETRTKKYTCEWVDCGRKSMPHASAYALKAHMRSHTREKPFYCALPECDRSFTRSDALAKHMRTVHETEALRPSDPIPKSMHPASKSSRLKLVIKPSQNSANGLPSTIGHINGTNPPGWTSSYPQDLGFTAEEEARGSEELWRLLRRQIHWAEEEGELLKRQHEAMEEQRKQEWVEKEILLDQVINNESAWHQRREKVLADMALLPSVDQLKAAARTPSVFASSPPPPMQPIEEQETAAVSTS